MRLNDPLVTSIEFDGKELPIDLTFDNVLDVLIFWKIVICFQKKK